MLTVNSALAIIIAPIMSVTATVKCIMNASYRNAYTISVYLNCATRPAFSI